MIPSLFNSGLMGKPSTGGGSVGGWVELARTTLGSAASSITVSSLSDKRYYMILTDITQVAGNINLGHRLNADTGSNYAHRLSKNGAADGTTTSATYIHTNQTGGNPWDLFNVGYLSNLSTNEKLLINHGVNTGGSGATNDPERTESVGKHAQTSNPVTGVTAFDIGAASNFDTNSEVVVLGWDAADTHTTNFWTELASVDQSTGAATLSSGTITAKKYLWIQCFSQNASSANTSVQLNNDTSGNYANRYSIDGGADTTAGSQIIAWTKLNSNTFPCFTNMFIINNSANEKLMFGHTVTQNTAGAGTAPKRDEFANKWVNTSAQITEIDFLAASGNITGNLRVWGSD